MISAAEALARTLSPEQVNEKKVHDFLHEHIHPYVMEHASKGKTELAITIFKNEQHLIPAITEALEKLGYKVSLHPELDFEYVVSWGF